MPKEAMMTMDMPMQGYTVRRRERDDALSVAGKYRPGEGSSTLAEKVVLFLLYAQKAAPGVYFQANVVAKAIHRLSRVPGLDSEVTQTVRGAVGRARHIMLTKHDCSLYVERGRGMRATIGADDAVRTRVELAAKRVVSAEGTLAKEASIVDPKQIKDEARRHWFKSEVLNTIRMLESDDRLNRLLPPKTEK